MDDAAVAVIISLALIAEAMLAIVAGAYIARIYLKRQGDSLLFRELVRVDMLAVIAGATIAAVAAGGFMEVRLPRPWGTLVVGLSIAVLMLAPISHAWLFYRLRRRRRDGTPPPLMPGD